MVSNSQGNEPPQSVPPGQPQQPSPGPSLDALALAEWLAEQRAAGNVPRLSALIAALPDAAGELADATMMDAVAESEEPPESESGAKPPPLSLGAQRALTAIFGAGDLPALAEHEDRDEDNMLARVAETPAVYSAGVATDESVGLLALAAEQHIDAAALAAQVMLSPDALRWLDRLALPREQQPDALVYHLVGALGVTIERVRAALSHGEIGAETADLASTLATSEMLTPAQRGYWSALLAAPR